MYIDTLRNGYKDAIIAIAAKYHADNIRIFGSVARGDFNENSDIDILVSFKQGASLLDEAGLNRELEDLLGKNVDVIGDDTIREEFKPFILSESVPL